MGLEQFSFLLYTEAGNGRRLIILLRRVYSRIFLRAGLDAAFMAGLKQANYKKKVLAPIVRVSDSPKHKYGYAPVNIASTAFDGGQVSLI